MGETNGGMNNLETERKQNVACEGVDEREDRHNKLPDLRGGARYSTIHLIYISKETLGREG